MSHPNTDRDERVRQIRERWTVHTSNTKSWGERPTLQSVGGMEGAMADIDYLLSLYDSQAAEVIALRKEVAASERYQTLLLDQPDAATRMRDRCLRKVKGLWTTNRSNEYNAALNDAVREIESLTLEVEQKQ